MSQATHHLTEHDPDAVDRLLQRWANDLAEVGLASKTIDFRIKAVGALGRAGIDVVNATTRQLSDFLARPSWSPQSRAGYKSALVSWFSFLHSIGRRGADPMAPLVLCKPIPGVPDGWATALEDWSNDLRAGGKPASTIYLRTYQMRRVALASGTADPWTITTQELVTWLGSREWAPETRRAFRSALVTFYRWAKERGRIDVNPATLLPAVPVPPGLPRPTPEAVLKFALQIADARCRLAILLAACCGLRREEIAHVHSEHVVGDVLRVYGKGRRQRDIPMPPIVAAAVAAAGRGYLFPGRIDGHLSPSHLGKLVSRTLGPGWALHSLRHRCATVSYAVHTDLLTTQKMLGHTRPETTQRYTAIPAGALRAATAATAAGL